MAPAGSLAEGPLFRPLSWHGRTGAGLSDRSVAEIVKARAAMAGYDPREFGGHSLRFGFVTTAGRQGVSLGDAMALSGHRGATVALRYHQAGAVLNNPPARLAD
jgi:site-specific recombinase XerD